MPSTQRGEIQKYIQRFIRSGKKGIEVRKYNVRQLKNALKSAKFDGSKIIATERAGHTFLLNMDRIV